jgi:hypothetical protein
VVGIPKREVGKKYLFDRKMKGRESGKSRFLNPSNPDSMDKKKKLLL